MDKKCFSYNHGLPEDNLKFELIITAFLRIQYKFKGRVDIGYDRKNSSLK